MYFAWYEEVMGEEGREVGGGRQEMSRREMGGEKAWTKAYNK
jgi:hypothetical protein